MVCNDVKRGVKGEEKKSTEGKRKGEGEEKRKEGKIKSIVHLHKSKNIIFAHEHEKETGNFGETVTMN